MKRELRLFDELDRFASPTISHALALTYGYDGDVAYERLWTPLIERFGVEHPIVLAGGSVSEGEALGVHVVRPTARVFHPKVFLALREDAVFAGIGSANLTKGGLGSNLELFTPFVFSKAPAAPPRSLLLDILSFLDQEVLTRVQAAPSTLAIARSTLQLASSIASSLPDRTRGPNLRFVHSGQTPLWTQLVAAHGDDPVERVVVVSPFFEDAEAEESDSLLRNLMFDGVPWSSRASRPRCAIHTRALTPGLVLPVQALSDLGDDVELRAQHESFEPRPLHAKLFIISGRKRTTVLWGSPNFTPSALLRTTREGGNVESALILSVDAKQLGVEQLGQELQLSELSGKLRRCR